jgi:hypothetical protein
VKNVEKLYVAGIYFKKVFDLFNIMIIRVLPFTAKFIICQLMTISLLLVKQLKEYQQARQIPSLQCFASDRKRRDETCADMMTDAKCFIPCFRTRNVCTKC